MGKRFSLFLRANLFSFDTFRVLKVVFRVHVFRHLKQFFEIEFKLEDAKTIGKMKGEVRQGGSQEGVLLKAMGVGYSNLNKTIL